MMVTVVVRSRWMMARRVFGDCEYITILPSPMVVPNLDVRFV